MHAEATKGVFEVGQLGPLPDVVLPSQFFDSVGAKAFSSEQRLMLAVLTDAINILGEYRVSPSQRKRESFDEASSWVFSEGVEGPLSFEHVCDALGVDVASLRTRLSNLVTNQSGTSLKLRIKQAGRTQRVTVNRTRRAGGRRAKARDAI
jgi:hypothetical protein